VPSRAELILQLVRGVGGRDHEHKKPSRGLGPAAPVSIADCLKKSCCSGSRNRPTLENVDEFSARWIETKYHFVDSCFAFVIAGF